MTDDWTPPTGEHRIPSTRRDDDRTRSDEDAIDPLLGIPERDLRLVDAYYHELGVVASEDQRPSTAAEQVIDDALLARIRETTSMSPDHVRATLRRRRGA